METRVKRRRRNETTVSSKHQITIPIEVLREAGFGVGDRLQVRIVGPGRVLLEEVEDPIQKYAGSLPDVYPEGYLEELRGEWDR